MTDQALATAVPLGPAFTEQQTREIDRQGGEAAVSALLTLAQLRADASTKPVVTPTTPSAIILLILNPKAKVR